MPKRRPMALLRSLGRRIRARRLALRRPRRVVAGSAEISITQLTLYESGQGHPPACTLHRIARALGTSSSDLLGETISDDTAEHYDVLVKLYSDPTVGAVVRYMQEMSKDERQSLQVIASAFAGRQHAPERVEVMQ